MADLKKAREAAEKFDEAAQAIADAVEMIREAKRLHLESGLDVGYSLSGNVDAYVINHLVGDADSIESKLEDYAQEIEMCADEEEDGEEVRA